jgi:hypothetical protein
MPLTDEPNEGDETLTASDTRPTGMDRRTRICLWVIMLGLANFFIYAIAYMFIGGEAVNGWVRVIDGQARYFLQSGREVSRAVYIYSGVHSTSIWITVAAVMLAMLTLAKDRIVSSMHSAVVRGRTFITILATIITMTAVVITIWFILQFVSRLTHSEEAPPDQPQAATRVWRSA